MFLARNLYVSWIKSERVIKTGGDNLMDFAMNRRVWRQPGWLHFFTVLK